MQLEFKRGNVCISGHASVTRRLAADLTFCRVFKAVRIRRHFFALIRMGRKLFSNPECYGMLENVIWVFD